MKEETKPIFLYKDGSLHIVNFSVPNFEPIAGSFSLAQHIVDHTFRPIQHDMCDSKEKVYFSAAGSLSVDFKHLKDNKLYELKYNHHLYHLEEKISE